MNLNGKKIFEVVNEINGEWIKRQTEQQSAQCVQEQCIILILSQKHLEKRHRLEAKSMQGLKWHSQENGGWNQDGWWDYPQRDQETWQARTKVKNHWEVLDTCSAWTEMLKKVFRVVNLCTHPLARTEKATGNKAKARTRFSFLGHPQHSHPARCHRGQLHLGTPPRPELLISLKVAQLSVPSLSMGLPLHSKPCIPPGPGTPCHGKGPPLRPLPQPRAQSRCQHHIPLQNRLSSISPTFKYQTAFNCILSLTRTVKQIEE